jgi:hypothetical protein
MEKEERGKISEKIIEILGLETYRLETNMFLIRDENGEVLQGVNFTDEVIDLTQFIEDYIENYYENRKDLGNAQ